MTTENERKLRAQLRAAKRPGPLQSRLTKVVQTGLVPYAAAVGLGYTAEFYGEEKGSIAILAATAGGLLGQALLNPKSGSVVDVVLSGAAAAGVSSMGIEHGRLAGRMHQARQVMAQAAAETTARDAELEADTRTSSTIEQDMRQTANG